MIISYVLVSYLLYIWQTPWTKRSTMPRWSASRRWARYRQRRPTLVNIHVFIILTVICLSQNSCKTKLKAQPTNYGYIVKKYLYHMDYICNPKPLFKFIQTWSYNYRPMATIWVKYVPVQDNIYDYLLIYHKLKIKQEILLRKSFIYTVNN